MNPALHPNDAKTVAAALVADLIKALVPEESQFGYVQVFHGVGQTQEGPLLTRPALEQRLQSLLKKHLGTSLERDGRDIGTASPQDKADHFAKDLAALETAYDVSVLTGVNVISGGNLWLDMRVEGKNESIFLGSSKDRGTR